MTASAQTMQPMRLSDEQLGEATASALAKLTPRSRKFAELAAGGTSFTEAAAQAGLSAERRCLQRLRVRVAPALALLREQARRASLLTLEAAVQRFRDLSDEARAAKDYGSATRALKEAATLLGLYPDIRLRISPDAPAVQVTDEEWVALARLRHEVRPALPAAQLTVQFGCDHLLPEQAAPDAAGDLNELPARGAAQGAFEGPSEPSFDPVSPPERTTT
jgi:hypothetical protein